MTKRTLDLIQRICALGFTTEEAWQIRRISMTLSRWAELECGDSNDFASWSIERAEHVKVTLAIPGDANGHVWIHENGVRTVDLGDIAIDSPEAARTLKRKQAIRDREIGKPFRVTYPHAPGCKPRREAIPDRESGALKRLARIVAARNDRWFAPNTEANRISEMPGFVLSYHQTDPRGASVYLLRASDVRPGEKLDSVYTRGVAVCE